MADSSFDIVSKIDKQEVANALNTASKEISTRYDFKGVGASLAFSGEHAVLIKANTEERALAVLDVFQTWLVKRKVSLKHLDYGKDEKPTLGSRARSTASRSPSRRASTRRRPRRSPRSSATRDRRRSSRRSRVTSCA